MFLESVHYNLVQNFKVTDWLFKTKPDFEVPRAFYKVKIMLKITLYGASKSQKKTAEFQNQVLFLKITNLLP